MALGEEYLRRKKRSALARILAALRFRVVKIIRAPAVSELEFIKITGNHGAYAENLRQLGLHEASDEITKNSLHVGLCWWHLAREHLEDAKIALDAGRRRSTLSRSYYAAYNASKAIRYITSGAVSLAGDDHRKASELPDDFPGVDRWAAAITRLYENRLISDYDNWNSSLSEFSLTPEEAFSLSREFLEKARDYLQARMGAML